MQSWHAFLRRNSLMAGLLLMFALTWPVDLANAGLLPFQVPFALYLFLGWGFIIAASLREGGRLVIVDRWFEMGSEETPGCLAWLLRKSLADPGFSLKTIEELEAALARAGLEPESIVELPYNKWKLISARKKVPVGDGHPDVPGLAVHALSFAGQPAVTPRGESHDGD